jgi:hypothetical protein
MTQPRELSRWVTRLRAPLVAALFLTLGSCGRFEPLTQPADVDDGSAPGSDSPSMAIAYAGGIPFGLFALPTNQFGSLYNGAVRNARILVETSDLRAELAAIRSRGGKIFIQLTGTHHYYVDADGHFSFTKWKQRLDMFKSINLSDFIKDGTIIAHFMIDEPDDPSNWGGRVVPPATLEAMAKYSKQLWPTMPTLVRDESTWLAQWSGTYQYLDAAWAQWVVRKGDPLTYIKQNVAAAQKKGLALVAGLNIAKGNYGSRLSASVIKSAGSALLSSTYPCAFISWEYKGEELYLATTAVKDAITTLRAKALNRAFKTCR